MVYRCNCESNGTIRVVYDDNPVANEISESVNEDGSVTVTLNGTDTNGWRTTYEIVAEPSNGTLNITNNEAVYSGDLNYNGTDTFTYKVVNEYGYESEVETVTIAIASVNDDPIISGDPMASVDEDSAYSFIPTGSDVDADTLTYSITNKPDWALFNTTTGELSGTPENDDVGTATDIQISVNDGTATVNMTIFGITINQVNDAPTIGGTPAESIDEDSGYSFIPTVSDEEGDTLTYSITNQPSWISFNSSDGSMVGTPNNNDVGSNNDIIITVSDGISTVSLATFNITVVNTNDAPVISGTLTKTGTEDDSIITANVSSTDIDNGSTVSYSITDSLTGTYGSISINETSGLWTYTMMDGIDSLDKDDSVTDSFTVQVMDDQGAIDTDVLAVSLTGVNDIPEISGELSKSGTEDDGTITATVSAVDGDESATMNFNISNTVGIYGDITIDANTGVWVYTMGNDINEPISGELVSDDFIVDVTDNNGATQTDTITVEISGVNDAPVISGSASTSVNEDTAYSFIPTASDVDTGDVHI